MRKNTEKKVIRKRGYFVQRSYLYDIQEERADGSLYIPDDAQSEDEWRDSVFAVWSDYLENNADSGAMIFHDKDINEDGTPKPLHVHAVVQFKNARTQSSVINALGLSSPSHCQPVKSYVDSYRYLLHVSETALNAKKHVYSVKELFAYNLDILEAMSRDSERKARSFDYNQLNDFIGLMHLRLIDDGLTVDEVKAEILEKFDNAPAAVNAYVKARSSFERDMQEYDEKRARDLLTNGRHLTTVYIEGPGGSGKTILARAMAGLVSDGRGYHSAVQDSDKKTFDFADGYSGQLCTVFDEVQAQSFQDREFFGVFDEYSYTPISSRNTNKHWLAEYAIFTNAESWYTWRHDLIRYSKGGARHVDPKYGTIGGSSATESHFWQASRRFSSRVVIDQNDDDTLSIYVYTLNKAKRGFSYAGKVNAPADFYLNDRDTVARSVWDLIKDGLSSTDKPVISDLTLKQSFQDVDTTSDGALYFADIDSRNGRKKVHY